MEPTATTSLWTFEGASHDATRWPLVVITLPAGGTDEAWQAFLDRCELCLSDTWRRQNHFEGRYATLLDISAVTDNNAKRRREWDALLARNDDVIQRDSLGTAVVLKSAIGRFIFTALQWLEAARGGKRQNVEVFRDFEDAEAWCAEQLEAEGLRLPVR